MSRPESPYYQYGKVSGGQWGGLTALATYSLLAAGENPHDPRLARAIAFLKIADLRGIYAIAMRAQVWPYLNRNDPQIHRAMARDGQLLLAGLKTSGPAAGMYGYLQAGPISDPTHVFDHSVSQYGVLGMWTLEEAGLEVPDRYWSIVDAAWRRDQQADGGWSYFDRPTSANAETVTFAAAGVSTLFLTDEFLRSEAGLRCIGESADPDIERGLTWIGDHFDSLFDSSNRLCYALYGIERIGAASGRKYFGQTDWWTRGADVLISRQNSAGAWDEGDGPVADTALGLLFLIRGRAPVIMNKLDYDSPRDNQRPRDLAHLAQWISRTIEDRRPLNWQTVGIDTDPDTWHDAQILYVCGRNELQLTDEQETKMKRFVEDGGLVLFNCDCPPNPLFSRSVMRLGEKLFHRHFRELPSDHPIYASEEFHRDQWRHPPVVLGLSNGARELMLLIPDADPSAAWQVNAPLEHPDAFQLGADIFLYAVDKEHLLYKGDSYLVKADPAVVPRRRIALARLNYGDGWDVEPGGWRRMAAVMHNRDAVDLDVEEVALGDGSLTGGDFQIAHMTGAAAFSLTAGQRDELHRFVTGGGTLIVDAVGGASAFVDSARTELGLIFGDDASQLDTPIAIAQPFYATANPKIIGKQIAFRPYARHFITHLSQPRLRAIQLNGRYAVFFSAEDLSVGLVGQSIDGIVGYEPDFATTLMERMILESAH
ncbi:MAG TPA: DUF4159 domain-containing protein [Tepidisphaeraceae bacterium]|nr:DUF4159 domain-containing protein [Tepidisphaeraceae bacterium]